jgi:mannose/fructose/N-acetylgalactosamine-specific phosphotransferase system component IIC
VEIIWAALAGMIVYLDTTALAQIMICQPVIACPAWGFFVGRPEVGLIFGVVFQFIWLGNLQIGAAKFAEGNIGAFVATVLATLVPDSAGGQHLWIVFAVTFVFGLVVSHLGGELTPIIRRIVGRLISGYVSAAESGNGIKLRIYFLLALAVHLSAGFLFALICLSAGRFTLRHLFGEFYRTGLSETLIVDSNTLLTGLPSALLGAGAAITVSVLLRKRTGLLFIFASIAFVTAFVLGRILWSA